MFYLILATILALATGVAKSIMDTLSLSSLFNDSILTRWKSAFFDSKEKTWRRKWRGGLRENGEKFPLSSTALVWLTDGWHFFQFVTSLLGTLAVIFGALGFSMHTGVLYTLLWTAVGFWMLRGVAFEISLLFLEDSENTRSVSAKPEEKPRSSNVLGWFWWIGAFLFTSIPAFFISPGLSVLAFSSTAISVFCALVIFTVSGNLRRWANWNSFGFVSGAGAFGFLLAIMADNLRKEELSASWGDWTTVLAVTVGFLPGIWAYLISKNWTPYKSERNFIAPKKPRASRIISVVWWALSGAFILAAVLSILHVSGSGPDWWPIF